MMLTPVAAARSASDQSRDSRSARIAAPADSRLIARSGHTRILHRPPTSSLDIRFYHVSLARGCHVCIRFCLRFHLEKAAQGGIDMEGTFGAGNPCTTNPELWFGY